MDDETQINYSCVFSCDHALRIAEMMKIMEMMVMIGRNFPPPIISIIPIIPIVSISMSTLLAPITGQSTEHSTQEYRESLQEMYRNIAREYREFFKRVRVAFNAHCEDIKKEAQEGLAKLDPEDGEGRKQVLLKQKKQLDQALAELKQLLNFESNRMRKKLEAIKRQQEMDSFSLEEELEETAMAA